MAESGNQSATSGSRSVNTNSIIFLQNTPISVKLKETNYLIWKQQVLATAKGYGLEGFLTGARAPPPMWIEKEVPNPEFNTWERQDQVVSAWLQSSLEESTMILIVGLTTSSSIWDALEVHFANQSRAKVMQYKHQLQTLKKDNMQMSEYLSKVKTCCDLLNSVGHHVSDEDQVTHILHGLGRDYDPVMVVVSAKGSSFSAADVHSLLLTFENRLELTKVQPINSDGSQPSLNFVASQFSGQRNGGFSNRGRGNNYHRGGYTNRGANNRGGYTTGRGRGRNYSSNKIICQVCFVPGHAANKCWHRFDPNFVPKQQHQYSQKDQFSVASFQPAANAVNFDPTFHSGGSSTYASTDYNAENVWFPDSGATHHVSPDFSNLNSGSEYQGSTRLQMGNGQGVDIAHIGLGHQSYPSPRYP